MEDQEHFCFQPSKVEHQSLYFSLMEFQATKFLKNWSKVKKFSQASNVWHKIMEANNNFLGFWPIFFSLEELFFLGHEQFVSKSISLLIFFIK
jgi:hypothetical protein